MTNQNAPTLVDQANQVKQFLGIFNEIEQHLRFILSENEDVSFSELTKQYERATRGWGNGAILRKYAKIRNLLVHAPTQKDELLAIPTQAVLEDIGRIRDALIKKQSAYDAFRKTVFQIDTADTLLVVLNKIRQADFSQFPVYNGKTFVGLLTENGITRWLAHRTIKDDSLIEFEDILVQDVLSLEEKRPNWDFVARNADYSMALEKFRKQPFLEALLITEKGQETEKLLGIATRWDILKVA